MKKKILAGIAAAAMIMTAFAGCSQSGASSSAASSDGASASQTAFDSSKKITVVTREEGSGTRDAFT